MILTRHRCTGVLRRNAPWKSILNHILDITGSQWHGTLLGAVTRFFERNHPELFTHGRWLDRLAADAF